MRRSLLAAAAVLLLPACLEGPGGGVDGLPAPASLSARPVDGAGVRLTWIDASADESGFRVEAAERPILSAGDVERWTLLPANAAEYTYQARPNRTTWFRVLAVRADRQSAPSNVVSATTPDVPEAPARLDAIVGINDSELPTLAWDDLGHETGYQIEREVDDGPWALVANLPANQTSYVDATASLNSAYRYRVRGVNANGAGVWSTSAQERTRDRSWDVATAGGGDLSWNMDVSVQHLGFAYVSCYDASTGRVVVANATSGGLTAHPIDPGFPASLGYGGTSVVATSQVHVVAADGFNQKLYHLSSTESGWRAEVVDDASADDRPILRKAPGDELRLVYRRSGRLRYAVESGGAWASEPMRETDAVDAFDFRVTPDGTAHVIYRRAAPAGGHELVHARKAHALAWTFETLPSAQDPEMLSLALTAGGEAFVSYNTMPGGELRLLSKRGGAWTDERVHASPRGSWGRYNGVGVDESGGGIHIVYSDNLNGALRYAGREPGEPWRLDLIDVDGDVGRHAVLARDGEGTLFVAYGDATRRALKVAMNSLRPPTGLLASPVSPARVELTWNPSPNSTEERLERSEDGGATWSDLGRVSGGTYADTAVEATKEYAYRVWAVNRFGQRAASETVRAVPLWRRDVEFARSSDFGARPSIDVGPDGREHVAHMDNANSDILYTVGRPDATTMTITADAGGGAGANLWSTQGAIAVSAGGVDVVAYQFNGGGVRRTRIQGLTPSSEVVDAQALTAVNPCLKVAPDGSLQVMFSEQIQNGQAFRHAVRGPSGWTSSRVFIGPLLQNMGSYFALDGSGNPHIVFASRIGQDPRIYLQYGVRSQGAWFWSIFVTEPESGGNSSLVVEADGTPHVIYVSRAGSVVYGGKAGETWSFEIFAREFPISGLPALAVDAITRRIHVAYGEGRLLRYRRRDPGGAWVERVLDDSTPVGDVALALDASGHPHIAYQLSALKKLRLTSGNP